MVNFNPRSHERSDSFKIFVSLFFTLFQSTLPREERHQSECILCQCSNHFNPRSHERSDVVGVGAIAAAADFNPRSHERSDNLPSSHFQLHLISIHAPTRGATYNTSIVLLKHTFQSTLPREERQSHLTASLYVHDFNPRSHERSDWWGVVCTSTIYISIHAPTRGATWPDAWDVDKPDEFQSTLPREERRVRGFIFSWIIAFQSTLPREERLSALCVLLYPQEFQSTLPREERPDDLFDYEEDVKFQSTLPREERQLLTSALTIQRYFNPRSHERSD